MHQTAMTRQPSLSGRVVKKSHAINFYGKKEAGIKETCD